MWGKINMNDRFEKLNEYQTQLLLKIITKEDYVQKVDTLIKDSDNDNEKSILKKYKDLCI